MDFYDQLGEDQINPGTTRPKIKKRKPEYQKLGGFSDILINIIKDELSENGTTNAMIPYQCFVYGVVTGVEEAPNRSTYVIRIKDETMSDVRVRIVNDKRSRPGPVILKNDVIRIHRVTVQVEFDEINQRKAMTLSTCFHHNYILFKVQDDGSIMSKTSAKNPSWNNVDEKRVIEISRWMKKCARREIRNEARLRSIALPMGLKDSPRNTDNDEEADIIAEKSVEIEQQIEDIYVDLICQILELRVASSHDDGLSVPEVLLRVIPTTMLNINTRRLFFCETECELSTVDIKVLEGENFIDRNLFQEARQFCKEQSPVVITGININNSECVPLITVNGSDVEIKRYEADISMSNTSRERQSVAGDNSLPLEIVIVTENMSNVPDMGEELNESGDSFHTAFSKSPRSTQPDALNEVKRDEEAVEPMDEDEEKGSSSDSDAKNTYQAKESPRPTPLQFSK